MNHDFERVAVVNRGEAAMRFISAVREYNHENGTALRTIALYTDPDRKAMFVREADEGYGLGPALVAGAGDGQLQSAYLDHDRLERALRETRAEAVWPGWGFVAEHAAFAELLERLGIVFIGPPPAAMRQLSDKIASKRLAERLDVPVVPWSGGLVLDLAQAAAVAERLGYPLMVKACAGGGGRGIRSVATASELERALASARAEAQKAFGDGSLFLERRLEGVRHVEVQVIADRHGTTWAAGVRDCTLQRRHQKVLEEAPAAVLTALQDAELRRAAVRICEAVGYESAGTVEFLFDPRQGAAYFLEVNARLQVEHPITEVTTGIDLVKLQLHIARGGRLVGEPPPATGHAIEVRLNAEDPENGFAPAPGTFARFRLPTGPGLRVDRGVTEGDVVAPEFDSMVAKIIAHGRTREEALARLRRALTEASIVVEGGATNRAFLLELIERPEFRSGVYDTGWLERVVAAAPAPRPHGAIALVQAVVEVYEAEHALERAAFYATAARLRPEIAPDVGRVVELRHQGQSYRAKVVKRGVRDYRVELDGRRIDVQVEPLGRFERWLTAAGRRFRVVSIVEGAQHVVEVEGIPHRFSRDDLGLLRATSPAVVAQVAVAPGDAVRAGDPLLVLEAMKMETTVVAPFAGRVRRVLVSSNVQVPPGTPLVHLDPEAEREEATGERLVLSDAALASDAPVEALRNLESLRRMVLGFDVEPAEARRLTEAYGRLAREDATSVDRDRREDEILLVFGDVASLFRRRAAADEDGAGSEEQGALSTGEYFLTYLRDVDVRGRGLPAAFLDKLQRAVAHYGVTSLEPSPDLRDALFWIWKARQRAEQQIPAMIAILDQRLARVLARAGEPDLPFVASLDRLIAATERRHPSLADVAREVRYRVFDQPLYERARQRAYADAERHLALLRENPGRPQRAELIGALVACPQPLFGLLAGRFEAETRTMRRLMIEVLTRRYYRIRALENVRTWDVRGWAGAAAEYEHEGRRIHLIATHLVETHVLDRRFPVAIRRLRGLVDAVPADCDVILDFYVWSPAPLEDAETSAALMREMLDTVGFSRPIRRVVVALFGPEAVKAEGRTQHFTFRASAEGFREDRLYRGMHPMMSKRLELRQLANFDLERLPSPEDVYLFKGVARENPKDERLFAVAEVRDATPVRDASGRVVQLPHLERLFTEAAAAMRAFQARRRPEERLHWNRLLFHVWPPLDVTLEELTAIAARNGPATAGLGLEKVLMRATLRNAASEQRELLLGLSNPGTAAFVIDVEPKADGPIRPLSEYGQKVTRMHRRGLAYPYELVRLLTPSGEVAHSEIPPGAFEEHDLDAAGRLRPVERPYGRNGANVVVGVIRNFTRGHPEGMARVILLGDPSREMGSIAEAECRRVIAALDLAAARGIPLEWFALSAGAKIAMDSGTENMDWISRVLRRIVEFTQAGGELNVIVSGINVGAQPYWNAEATMLMHTKGILVMVPESAMVLTGKTALDYSGSVSAEDNFGIGGYERIMGPNGQAQYWAPDLAAACRILLRHYEHAYVALGERFPRRAATVDPFTRDVRAAAHGNGFAFVGEIFADATNPGRKKPFDIRRVMAATVDQDHPPLERWCAMRDADTAVVWDAHLGGIPVMLLGIESKPVPRLGFVPTDGPEQWMSGTLFPKSSKKVARAINAASANRPLVILANLSGFDGSPESMRRMQLEFGAEIGRAVVNFQGPIVFCVVSRYHGGAFVVFSKALNENFQALALEGSFASVIGGAPAAAVVFAREVDARTKQDPRVVAAERELQAAADADKRRLRGRLEEVARAVRSEKLGAVAEEFDAVHSIERALRVGSLDRIIPASELRPQLIAAVERGMALEFERIAHADRLLAEPAAL